MPCQMYTRILRYGRRGRPTSKGSGRETPATEARHGLRNPVSTPASTKWLITCTRSVNDEWFRAYLAVRHAS